MSTTPAANPFSLYVDELRAAIFGAMANAGISKLELNWNGPPSSISMSSLTAAQPDDGSIAAAGLDSITLILPCLQASEECGCDDDPASDEAPEGTVSTLAEACTFLRDMLLLLDRRPGAPCGSLTINAAARDVALMLNAHATAGALN